MAEKEIIKFVEKTGEDWSEPRPYNSVVNSLNLQGRELVGAA